MTKNSIESFIIDTSLHEQAQLHETLTKWLTYIKTFKMRSSQFIRIISVSVFNYVQSLPADILPSTALLGTF